MHTLRQEFVNPLGDLPVGRVGRCTFVSLLPPPCDGSRNAVKRITRQGATLKLHQQQDATEDDASVHRGLAEYVHRYQTRIRDRRQLQHETDAYMATYDEREEELRRQLEARAGIPDADGFITVLPGGRRTGVNNKRTLEDQTAKLVIQDFADLDGPLQKRRKQVGGVLASKSMKKDTQGIIQDFYRFQRRERKRER